MHVSHYVNKYIYIYIHTNTYKYIYTYIHVYIYIHTYINIYTLCMYMLESFKVGRDGDELLFGLSLL